MEKVKVYVGYSHETNDMGIANYHESRKEVPAENLVEGGELILSRGRSVASVVSFIDGVLVFKYRGEEITLNPGHSWNTPMYRVDNPYIYESEGWSVTIEFERDPEKEEQYVDRVVELLDQMRKNASEEGWKVWKNIPLAKEYLDILRNRVPLHGKHIDANGIIVCCDAIFLEDLLDKRDVPRLCLEFLQLRKFANSQTKADDAHYDNDRYLGVLEADKIQNRLDFYIDPHVTMEWWVNYTGAHLKFDPVERTPEWEDCIYEVEKEVDEKLGDEPRGMGFCFSYWSVKKAVLAKHGIDWSTPSMMNPKVMFD